MITFQMLQKVVNQKENSEARKRVIKRKNVEIYRRILLYNRYYTLILFTKAKKVFMELYDAKASIITLDKYILILEGPTSEKVDFNQLRVLNIDNGTVETKTELNFGLREKKDIVIVDEHLLVVKQKSHPRFAVIINDSLTEIPFITAQEILYFPRLNSKQQNSIKAFYSHEKWENHNNILINPINYSVPSSLALTFFCKKRPTGKILKNVKKLNTQTIEFILSSYKKDKPQITYLYLQSDNLQQ